MGKVPVSGACSQRCVLTHGRGGAVMGSGGVDVGGEKWFSVSNGPISDLLASGGCSL